MGGGSGERFRLQGARPQHFTGVLVRDVCCECLWHGARRFLGRRVTPWARAFIRDAGRNHRAADLHRLREGARDGSLLLAFDHLFACWGDQCRRWTDSHFWTHLYRRQPLDGRGNAGSWFLYAPAFRRGDLAADRSALLACNGPRRRLWHRLRRSYLAYNWDVPGPDHARRRSYYRNPCQRRSRPDFDARLLVHRPRRTCGRHAGRRLVRIATGARVEPPPRASMRRRGTNSGPVALSANQEAGLTERLPPSASKVWGPPCRLLIG